MEGRSERALSAGPGSVIYCIVPRDLADKLHEPLRRHFRDDPRVRVIVERRGEERRRGADRRIAAGAPRPRGERRKVRAETGRRVGERRGLLVATAAPELPRKARAHAERLAFVERMEPSGQEAEDRDTARLVTRIQAGEAELFTDLYMRYFERVYTYMRMVLKNPTDAEDATQQVFVKVLEGVSSYRQRRGSPFRAWLFVVARNHVLNYLAKEHRITGLDANAVRDPRPEAAEERLEALGWISDQELLLFVERLPLAQRQVLFLRYVLGLTSAEVAQVLGQNPDAVRKQHARALKFLRDRLSALGREPQRSNRVGTRVLLRKARVVRRRRFVLNG